VARRPLERELVHLDGGRRTTQLMRDSLGRSWTMNSIKHHLHLTGGSPEVEFALFEHPQSLGPGDIKTLRNGITLLAFGTYMGPRAWDPPTSQLELTVPDGIHPSIVAQWLYQHMKNKVEVLQINGVAVEIDPRAIEQAITSGAA